jgi:FSR family fosmidomycin resistance protein-like MFS transporter
MSLFMASGEMGFTIGPLLAVWAVTQWTLDGFWRLMFLGWATSLILFWRLRKVSARPEKTGSLRAMIPAVSGLFVPIIFFNLFRNPMIEGLTTYLPTYISGQGKSLWLAGSSLSMVELAGVFGALIIGMLSDRMGRKRLLFIASIIASFLMMLFLSVEGWIEILVLMALGFTSFSTMPILLAIVQDQFPNNRAVANGLYMMVIFLLRPLGTLFIGTLGDHLGLERAYWVAAFLSLLTLPAIFAIPEKR